MSTKFENRNLESDIESIKIPLNKTKISLMVLASIVFICLGVWFVNSFANMQSQFNPLLIRIIGIAAIVVFGFVLYYSISKFFDKQLGLIISTKGVFDNSNGTSIGLIEWSDIKDIQVIEIWNTKSIILKTDEPEKYIAKATHKQAKLMRANLKFYGSPLTIVPQTLKIDFEQLYKLLMKAYNIHHLHVE